MPTKAPALPAPERFAGPSADRAARRDVAQRFPFSEEPVASTDVESASPPTPETVGGDALTARDASPQHETAPAKGVLSTSRDVARGQSPIEAANKDDGAESLRAVASQCLSDAQYPSFLVSSPLVDPEPKPATGIDAYFHRRELFSRLTEQQKTAIDLILCGKKFEAIAAQLGIHRGTLWRWRRTDMDFRHALAMARDNAMEHASEQLRELVPRALEVVQSQIDKDDCRTALHLLRLVRIDRHDPPPTRLNPLGRVTYPSLEPE